MTTKKSSSTGATALDTVDCINQLHDHVLALINVLGIEEKDMPTHVMGGTRIGLADAGKQAIEQMKFHIDRLADFALKSEASKRG